MKDLIALVKPDQFVQFHGVRGVIQIDETDGEDHASQQVHFQCPEGALDGLFVIPIADQQSGTDGGYFPEEIEPDEIIGKNNAEHGGMAERNTYMRKAK